jgi:hypothetical protein
VASRRLGATPATAKTFGRDLRISRLLVACQLPANGVSRLLVVQLLLVLFLTSKDYYSGLFLYSFILIYSYIQVIITLEFFK